MRAVLVAIALALSGCTLDLVDKRLDPVRLQALIQEMQRADQEMARLLVEMSKKIEEQGKK